MMHFTFRLSYFRLKLIFFENLRLNDVTMYKTFFFVLRVETRLGH